MRNLILKQKLQAVLLLTLAMIFSNVLFAQVVPQEKTDALTNQTSVLENSNEYEMWTLRNPQLIPDAILQGLPNPPLGEPCPLKLVLVLDESGSIDFSGGTAAVRTGVNNFIAGLVSTGTQMAIIEFANTAARVSINSSTAFQTVDASFQSAVSTYLLNDYNPLGATNWADAFSKVSEINDEGSIADIVIFFTDGQPNLPSPTSTALQSAIDAADLVKGDETRIFMLGVGSGVYVPNLQAVSGPLQVDPPTVPFAQADYGLEGDFSTIATSLANLSTAFLTLYYVDADGDTYGAGNPTTACDAPGVNYVTNNLDCDDNDPDIYPGAPELCDGKDNDCVGVMADADCDGIEDFCDICPGGDDSIDANGDGFPDCAYPPAFGEIDPSWQCANKKVYVCHVDEYGMRFNLCVSHNAIPGHMGHGDFLGPCVECLVAKTAHAVHIGELNMNVYPVPVENFLIVEVISATSETGELSITDYLGRVVYMQSVRLSAGENNFEIQGDYLGSGIYLLSVTTENAKTTTKITVK